MTLPTPRPIHRFVLALALAPAGSLAQVAPLEEPRAERIEVTGSNIKRTEVEGPAPLLVLRREDLALRAGQNLQEVLIGLPYANFGSFAETRTSSTARLSLRGLGADATLVLVNGRRVAVSGQSQGGGVAFVDINTIPTTAIERIEILKDGASAIYGSDAIAGVVNIILRKDFQGSELAAAYGESGRGDTADTRAALTAGTGNLARDGFNAMATLEYYHRDRLMASQRERSRTADQRANGGSDWRQTQGRPGTWLTAGRGGFIANTPMPGCPAEALDNALSPSNLCAFNENDYLVTYPRAQRKSVFGRAAAALSPSVTAFLEGSWMKAETELGGVPAGDGFTLPVGHNSNPFAFPVPILYRWLEVGPRFTLQDARMSRVVAGIEGSTRDIDFEAAYNRATYDSLATNVNYLSVARRNALLAGNAYSFVDSSRNAGLLDGAQSSTWRSRFSAIDSVDGKASGTAHEFPAGPLRLAAGFERRRERLSSAADPDFGTFVTLSPDSHEAGSRTVTALFAESGIDLYKTLEAQLAVRHERYSDFGDSTAPKVALAWKPAPGMLFRAGYSRGFHAPSLVQLHLDQSIQLSRVRDSPRCNAYSAAFGASDARSQAACAFQEIRTVSGGNPSLAAEESTGRTLGFVIEPARGLSIAVDAFDIRQRGRVAMPTFETIFANEDAFPGAVVRDPQGPNDVLAGSRGPIVGSPTDAQRRIGVYAYFFNSTSQEARGVDVEVQWRLAASPGTLELQSINTFLQSLRSAGAPGLPEVDLSLLGRAPRYRGWHSGSWSTGPWTASAVVNAVGRSSQPAPTRGDVPAWTTVDLQAVYSGWRTLVLTAGVRNVADRAPPKFDDVLGFDESTQSLVGRFFYLRAVYTFR